jgi:hypothetical protein
MSGLRPIPALGGQLVVEVRKENVALEILDVFEGVVPVSEKLKFNAEKRGRGGDGSTHCACTKRF